MTTNTQSVIDHARLEKAARDIRAHAPDFNVDAECAAVIEAFDREIKEGTDCDISASIWQEPRENLVRWLGLIREKVAEIQGGMNDDAAWLEEFSRKARNIQDGAATKAQSLGSDLGSLGVSNPSPSKPSVFDPRTFHDTTPSITVPTVPTPSTPAASGSPVPPQGPQGNTEEAAPSAPPATTNTQEATPTPQSAAPTPAPTPPQSNAEEVAPTPSPTVGGNAVET
ncbi:hypothetical protein [Tsukamurella pseudospumae]|uniref:Uncharacterized protein n=1 Tax=Tsukamurella pseudospumae TaxID=239498 RepID=A0A138AWE3_9ACTN|nr:hypothetical protein [Tsukamurella pseudospumae]KXP14696.1 hypothetical protein AXK60_02060 [Tsukamurella pseudospumae]